MKKPKDDCIGVIDSVLYFIDGNNVGTKSKAVEYLIQNGFSKDEALQYLDEIRRESVSSGKLHSRFL